MFLSANLLSAAILSAVVPFAFAMSFTVSPGLTTCTPLPSSLPGLLPYFYQACCRLLYQVFCCLLYQACCRLLCQVCCRLLYQVFCCLPLLVLEHRLALASAKISLLTEGSSLRLWMKPLRCSSVKLGKCKIS